MIRTFLLAACLMMAAATGARAQTCTLPNLLQNATIADATQVMQNMNSLAGCINALSALQVAATSFCGSGQPDGSTDNSACVQATVSVICATSPAGGQLLLGPGKWKFHDIKVTCDGVHFVGGGEGGSGTQNGAPLSSLATSVDCSGMTSFCIQFIPNSSPAQNRLVGDSAEKIAFFNTAGSGNVLDFEQIQDGYIRDVMFTGSPNAVKILGALNFDAQTVSLYNIAGNNFEITGNLTGKASGGGACTIGNCSTRTDQVTLRNIRNFYSPTSDTFLNIHDQAFTVQGFTMVHETGGTGVKVRCTAGQPSISYCPQFLYFWNLQTEGINTPVDLQDYTDFRCETCFLYGIGTSATTNAVTASLVNYSQAGGAGGGLYLMNSHIGSANNACINAAVSDVQIIGGEIYGCNGAAAANPSNPGIEFVSGFQDKVDSVSFCNYLGTAPRTHPGILIDSAAFDISLVNNSFISCSTPAVVNNSTNPRLIHEINSQPSPAAPGLSAATGLGLSPTTAYNGTGLAGQISLTTGTGSPASTGAITLTYSDRPTFPGPNCSAIPGSSNWQAGAQVIATTEGNSGGNSVVTFQWNNAGSALSTTTAYLLNVTCTPTNW